MLKAERSVKATATCLYWYAHIATCVLLAAKSFRWPAAADWGHWTKFTTVSAKQGTPPPLHTPRRVSHWRNRYTNVTPATSSPFCGNFSELLTSGCHSIKNILFFVGCFFTINAKNVYYAYFFLFFRCKWSFGFICDWLWQEFSWKLRGVRYIFLQ